MSEQSSNPYGTPPPPPPGAYGAPGAPRTRPGGVTAAAVITIVASAITLLGSLAFVVLVLASRADFIDEVEKELATNSAYDNISAGTVADIAVGFLAVLVVWCVVAIVLAVATMRGSNGARITLIVSASVSALVSLLGALVIVPLLLTIASIATVVLLLTGGAGEWFASRRRTG